MLSEDSKKKDETLSNNKEVSRPLLYSCQYIYIYIYIYKKKKETLWVSGKYIKKNWRAAGLELTT